MKQAIIYTRFSPRPRPDDTMSCEFQLEKCRQYCDLHGLDVLANYEDRCLSGKRDDNRPGLNRALVKVCKEQGVLVVYTLARLSRSIKYLIFLSETLEKQQADLAVVTQHIDTTNPYGRFYFFILAALGQLQREETGAITKEILLNMQAAGYLITRRPPYGFKINPKDPKRIIPNPDETVIIRVICNCYNRGMGWTKTKQFLEANGHLPRTGTAWPLSTIIKVVRRHVKKGRHRGG